LGTVRLTVNIPEDVVWIVIDAYLKPLSSIQVIGTCTEGLRYAPVRVTCVPIGLAAGDIATG
jgi:hypothetical protein